MGSTVPVPRVVGDPISVLSASSVQWVEFQGDGQAGAPGQSGPGTRGGRGLGAHMTGEFGRESGARVFGEDRGDGGGGQGGAAGARDVEVGSGVQEMGLGSEFEWYAQ